MTLYDSMVESYAPQTAAERFAVQQEVMQLIALAWQKGWSIRETVELGAGVIAAKASRHTIADRTAAISKGITRLDIPESGYAIIKGEKRK